MPMILLQGLIFGIAYVAPIGAQNMFVINYALNNNYKNVLKVIWIVIFFDISLAIACFVGIGIVFDFLPFLKIIVLCAGCMIITYLGIRLIIKRSSKVIDNENHLNMKQIIISSFSVAWFNPQAIIDGTVLFGSLRSTLPENRVYFFIAGVCFASIIWFNIISIIANKMKDRLSDIIKYVNVICGVILIFFGIKFGYSFIKSLIMVYGGTS
ncbi:MAG: LysE family transporter [Treponema sp.]|jgi:L-lysine exporter family protein LysE/ArgO|nr:LysE family transporter [Treponema sp.]